MEPVQSRSNQAAASISLQKPTLSSTTTVDARSAAAIGAAQLLAVESKVRAAKSEPELLHLIANELRKIVSARQVFVFRARKPGRFEIASISSMATVDREVPFIRRIERVVSGIVARRGDSDAEVLDLSDHKDADDADADAYPFTHLLWRPIQLISGGTFAGVLLAREIPWTEQDAKIVAREAEVFGNNWQAIYGYKQLQPKRPFRETALYGAIIAAVVIMVFPVSLTTLAPVEIVAKSPQRVTAPVDGVIKEIVVDPNRPVKKGDLILTFDRTTALNSLQIAQQELLLAKAKLDRTTQASFTDERFRRELELAQAEYDLKRAERDYAKKPLNSRLA